MKAFEHFAFDPRQCREQVDDLEALLEGQAELSERRDVLGFFRSRKHLSAFIGSYFTYLENPDRIAFEYDIFGDFKADLAVGDSESGQYCFVEFEDATADSIFVSKRGRATPEWSERFEHGFSQVLDWFWKLDDMEGTTEFNSRFGASYAGYEGMLIIGRSNVLDYKDRQRLKWRRDRVIADSKHVHCITYDELC